MEALLILLCVALLVGMVVSVFRCNAWSQARYEYKPFSWLNFLAVLPGYLLFFAGLFFQESDSATNAAVIFVAMLGYWGVMTFRIAQRCHPGLAVYSMFVMIVAWLPIIMIFLLRNDAAGQKHRQQGKH